MLSWKDLLGELQLLLCGGYILAVLHMHECFTVPITESNTVLSFNLCF